MLQIFYFYHFRGSYKTRFFVILNEVKDLNLL